MKRFAEPKARNYELRIEDGTVARHVIVLYMGNRKVGFIEYDAARKFVDRIHDLCDDHERDHVQDNSPQAGRTPAHEHSGNEAHDEPPC